MEEQKAQEKKEVQTAWEIWNLINRLDVLLWERYDAAFLQIHSDQEDEKWLRSIGLDEEEKADP